MPRCVSSFRDFSKTVRLASFKASSTCIAKSTEAVGPAIGLASLVAVGSFGGVGLPVWPKRTQVRERGMTKKEVADRLDCQGSRQFAACHPSHAVSEDNDGEVVAVFQSHFRAVQNGNCILVSGSNRACVRPRRNIETNRVQRA